MILAPQGIASGRDPQRRRFEGLRGLGRRQTLGSNLLTGLVEWWPLNEQSGQRRGVHAGLDLTDNNTVTGADGVGSLASQFTRANSEYLSRSSESAVQMGDIDCTFTAWVNLETTGSEGHAFISKDTTAAGGREFNLQLNLGSGLFRFVVSGDGSTAAVVDDSTTGAPSTGSWYFIIGYHDAGNNEIGISTNVGTAVTASHTTGIVSGSTEFRLGRFAASGAANVNGRIQRVGMWKRLLTSDEQTFLYNSGRGCDYPFV